LLVLLCALGLGACVGGEEEGAQAKSAAEPPRAAGTLRVAVTGVRNENGLLHCCIFSSEAGFPQAPDLAVRQSTIKASATPPRFAFPDLPHGEYAVSVLHDENANLKLDVNFLGIPREGVGVSNNPEPRMGPPRYEEAAIQMEGAALELVVDLRYP
jgi:uncharacterized protein (DUF2141 family)